MLVERVRRARAAGLWLALAWLGVVLVVRPEVRESLRVYAQVYWLLIFWFLLARTKTVSWRLVAGVFSVAATWSLVIGAVTYHLATGVGAFRVVGTTVPGSVGALGPSVALAGLGEESLKLVPLVVLAIVAPGRVRRFAVVDWLLVGFASGLAFQGVEEVARRTAANVRGPGLLDLVLGQGADSRGPGSGYPQYGWGPLGGAFESSGGVYAGHHVMTGLTAASVGLGVAAWRHAGHATSPAAGVGWRGLGVALPVLSWWATVSVHAGYNATTGVGQRWLTTDRPSVPWPIRVGWRTFDHGHGFGWALLALLGVGLLVDARHLVAGDRRTRLPGGFLPPFDPVTRADAWATRLAPTSWSGLVGWWRAVLAAGCAVVAYTGRDVAFVVAAHAREPGESRRRAIGRGRAAVALVAANRAQAYDRWRGAGPVRGTATARGVAIAALAVLGVAAFWVAPAVAGQIGDTGTLRATLEHTIGAGAADGWAWLAAILDSLGAWWGGLDLPSKILVGVGVAALIALSGGSLGLAFGVSGAATYLLDHASGAATFTRDPVAATRSWLTTTTPWGAVLDVGEFALTFAPGNFAGAIAGREIRELGTNAAHGFADWRYLRGEWHGPDGLRLDVSEFAAVKAAMRSAAVAERSLTPRLAEIPKRLPTGRLEGLGDVLKERDSLARKIATVFAKKGHRDVARALGTINDRVRYTIAIPDANYAREVTDATAALKDSGYEFLKWKNRWGSGQYQGINSFWRDPVTGQTFEVQFHTPASFHATKATHGMYDVLRLPGVDPVQQRILTEQQNSIFAKVTTPAGAEGLGGPS